MFDYVLYNSIYEDDINPEALEYLVYDATRGSKGGGNYLWNDKYSESESGSPYYVEGLQNVYELDSITVVPIPSAIWLLGAGLIGLIGFRKKFR